MLKDKEDYLFLQYTCSIQVTGRRSQVIGKVELTSLCWLILSTNGGFTSKPLNV